MKLKSALKKISKPIAIILLVIIVLLIIARLAMAPILLRYVVKRLNEIPEYRTEIEDLNIHLWRGSYSLVNIKLKKINKNIPVPFFAAKIIDFSIEWKSLLHGSIVAKITADKPELNFVIDPSGNQDQLSIDDRWQQIVKSLYPLNINLITTDNGLATFQSFTSKPPFKLGLQDIHLTISNMQEVVREEQLLSSKIDATAKNIDGGTAEVHGKFNPFTKQPTFYITATLKDMQLKQANNFIRHYIATDVAGGTFNLYVEAAAQKGQITGYAKPIVKNLKILNPDKPAGPIETLYKGALEIVAKILKNRQNQTVATQINLSGRIDDPDTSTLSIIGYLLRHAFIQALLPQVDHTIEMRDVIYPTHNQPRRKN